MARISLRASCAILVLAVPTCVARADGVVLDLNGVVPGGRGGTNIGFGDNGILLLDNPAGLVNLPGTGISEVGLHTIIGDLEYADPQNSRQARFQWPENPATLPQLAVVRKTPDGNFAYGLGVFAPGGFGVEYRLAQPLFGERNYRSLGTLVKILPGAAYRINDQLSIGGTLGVAVTHAQLESPFFVQTGPFAGLPTLTDLEATGAAPTGSVGLQYQVTPHTTLGVAYVSESRFDVDGFANVTAFGLAPRPIFAQFDLDGRITWPRSIGVGVRHELDACQTVALDLVWFDWSSAFDDIALEFSDANNPALAGVTIKDRIPLDWRDTLSVKTGYQYDLGRTVLRAGYVYHRSPAPDATLTPLIPAILEHLFSLGITQRFPFADVHLAYSFTFGPNRSVPDSALLGGDYDASRNSARYHTISLGVSRSF